MTISRRTFCRSAIHTALTIPLIGSAVQASDMKPGVRFYKNLACGHLGVQANQAQALDYAVKYGFDSITPNAGEFEGKPSQAIREWLTVMQEKGIRYGCSGLPVEFRRDEARFKTDLAQLPKQASLLQQLGVTRMATWILPGHNELTYLENFAQHKQRLRDIATVLKYYDIRLGLEFVGPRTARSRSRFPFVCAQRDMMELVEAIDTGNVGLLVDSWHWYTSHGTVEELLGLSNQTIVHVHVNDAPAGIAVDQQVDNRRALPVTTGVIDIRGFINALAKIGYDGPVECEPFDQSLRSVDPGTALQRTADSLDRLWGLISV
ncbi:MAG: sugar phosphate isomerase/epimerase [Phycisphaerae bacterium]|nr:sugar phosphate isomerase/epimerase [Phycisphaerae bacterium]